MKKNGFTLVEILAVLVLISLLAIISIPSILNYINQKDDEISEITKKLIFNGVDLYMNNNNFVADSKNTYCVILKDVVSAGYLESPLVDSNNGEEINLNNIVKVTYNYDDDLKKDKVNYEIVEHCDEIINNN